MDIKLHSVHFNAKSELKDFVEDRVNKLDQFHDKIIGGEVFLRLGNSKDDLNKVAEIKLTLPGKELFAKKQSKSFEESMDVAIEALRRQLRKHKTKSSF